MSRVRKVTNSLNLDKWKNQNFGTQIEPVACIVSYIYSLSHSLSLSLSPSISHWEKDFPGQAT